MTEETMTDTQGEMFGEVGGLFGPETISTTPLDQLDLPREIAPGVILSPTEKPDAYENAPCSRYEADGIDGPLGEHCATCGWPESEHDDARPPLVLGVPDPGGLFAESVEIDDDDQDDDTEPWPDVEKWSADNLPTLADCADWHAPWLLLWTLTAETDADAVETMKRTLNPGGSGGPKGILWHDGWGTSLHIITRTGDEANHGVGVKTHRVASWQTLARALRRAATADEITDLRHAFAREHEIDTDQDADPRPWLSAHEYEHGGPEARAAHEAEDEAWHERSDRRHALARPFADAQRAICAAIVARLHEPHPGALF